MIYSDAHQKHAGAMEYVNGRMVPMFEKPERMDMVLKRLSEVGFGDLHPPESFGTAPILRVHEDGYVDFLQNAYARFREHGDEADFASGFVFAMRGLRQAPNPNVYAQFGYYTFDLSVPFVEGTWEAIEASSDVALTGRKALSERGERAVFSICRPPGHHAGPALAGGYCYVNNVAVAAQAFRDAGAKKVSILDVDYHHGNGTQAIFYDRDDVLFVSLHGDPDQEYPYFAGYAEETGSGAGEGYNVNYPMPWGTGWQPYAEALERGIARNRDYRPEVLLVSLGVDTFTEDPISHFKLGSDDYLRMGEMIAGLDLPTHFVMEGGYAVEEIGINAVGVLTGFEEA